MPASLVESARPRPSARERRRTSVLDYVPLTGPIPRGHQAGVKFIHESVRIDLAMATAFMAVNAPYNRPLSKRLVNQFAKEMIAGEWDEESPEGMVFSQEGHLIDGQTRCAALILACQTKPDLVLTLDVHHNYPKRVYRKLNRGNKRTKGHAVGGAGYKSANNLAAVADMLVRYRSGRHYSEWNQVQQSPDATVDLIDATPGIPAAWEEVRPLKVAYMNQTAAGVGIFLLRELCGDNKKSKSVVDAFLLGVADPVEAEATKQDPRTVLNRVFERKSHTMDLPRHGHLGLFLRAWELWCKGKATTVLIWNEGQGRNSDMPSVYVPETWNGIMEQWVRP